MINKGKACFAPTRRCPVLTLAYLNISAKNDFIASQERLSAFSL